MEFPKIFVVLNPNNLQNLQNVNLLLAEQHRSQREGERRKRRKLYHL
jgi:hypothetical protein